MSSGSCCSRWRRPCCRRFAVNVFLDGGAIPAHLCHRAGVTAVAMAAAIALWRWARSRSAIAGWR